MPWVTETERAECPGDALAAWNAGERTFPEARKGMGGVEKGLGDAMMSGQAEEHSWSLYRVHTSPASFLPVTLSENLCPPDFRFPIL